jgi:class 3 adenylate cyclase
MDQGPSEVAGRLPNAPTGTVTFLFTDIEGSTRLLERLREQYATVLAEQRELLTSAFARWRGHAPSGPLSRSNRRTRRQSSASAGNWTDCRWRSSWPRRV